MSRRPSLPDRPRLDLDSDMSPEERQSALREHVEELDQFNRQLESQLEAAKERTAELTEQVDRLERENDTLKTSSPSVTAAECAHGKEPEIDEERLPERYLLQREKAIEDLQTELDRLAERYRSLSTNSALSKQVVEDYHEVFQELVRVNGGIIALEPTAELPDRLMPKQYVEYWLS